jgi:putative membrane protein
MEWLKALHVIAVISWMAGMLYLPRLFVYHADAEKGSVQSETFKIMERRLLRGIMNPAMIVAWLAGLSMIVFFNAFDWSQGWSWAKIGMVILLSAYHGLLSRHRKAFAEDRNDKPSRYFRLINEVPTLLMIGIVIMIIVRPF